MSQSHQRSTPTTPTTPILLMNSSDHQPQQYPSDSDWIMQIDEQDDLSLFRSHSMPIPTCSGGVGSEHVAFQTSGSAEDSNQDEDDEEDDDDDLLATPPFLPPSIKHLSTCQRLFSSSLPPSLDRRKTNSGHAQHENPLHEFIQLTQPMREGLISREKLLPSSRMKQVGIGGRGRRALSNHKMNQHIYSPTSEFSKFEPDGTHLPSPIKFGQNLSSPDSSNFTQQQSMNNNLSSSIGSTSSTIVNSQFAEVPLIRPRPILAWDHPNCQSLKKEIPISNQT